MLLTRIRATVIACMLLLGVGSVAASTAQAAEITPEVDFLTGRGEGRVEITSNGRFAIVHQGSSYSPNALLKIDLLSDPPRVIGQSHVPAQIDGALALSGNRFAYSTREQELWVMDVRGAVPRMVRKVGFRIDGSRATVFDIVVSPNGRFAYATAGTDSRAPGSHLLVMRLRNDGLPEVMRRVEVRATHLAISRNGKRLVAADGTRAHVFDLYRPTEPRRHGRPIVVRGGFARALAFGINANTVYVLSAGRRYSVSRLNVRRGGVTQRRTLVSGLYIGVGGGLAVSANGRQVVVTNAERDGEDAPVWVLTANLRPLAALEGPCLPGSAAASLNGPTRGRLFVADSGICEQARLWRVHP